MELTNDLQPKNVNELIYNYERLPLIVDVHNIQYNDQTFNTNIQYQMSFCARTRHNIIYFLNTYICKEKVYYKYLNKLIAITLHIFFLSIFETYFFFKYVSVMEKNAFLDKLDWYVENVQFIYTNDLTQSEQDALNNQVHNYIDMHPNFIDNMHNKYQYDDEKNKENEHDLIIYSWWLSGFIGAIHLVFLILGLIHYKKIEWKWLMFENLMMIALLAFFEYYFFINVIIDYDPISTAEINYNIMCDFLKGFSIICSDYVNNSTSID
jgi:hypothetical protein